MTSPGIEPSARVTRDLIYGGFQPASNQGLAGKRQEAEWTAGGRERELEGEAGGRKQARPLIALPRTGIIYRARFIPHSLLQESAVYWEVYLSARLSLTPAGMWKHARSRLNFIYEQIATLEPSCSLVTESKNLKELQNSGRTETWKPRLNAGAGLCSGCSHGCSFVPSEAASVVGYMCYLVIKRPN